VHAERVCTETINLEVTISGTHTGLVAWPARHRGDLRSHLAISTRSTATINLPGERIYYDRATVFARRGVFREPIGWVGPSGSGAQSSAHNRQAFLNGMDVADGPICPLSPLKRIPNKR
jgi:hypothetical protein